MPELGGKHPDPLNGVSRAIGDLAFLRSEILRKCLPCTKITLFSCVYQSQPVISQWVYRTLTIIWVHKSYFWYIARASLIQLFFVPGNFLFGNFPYHCCQNTWVPSIRPSFNTHEQCLLGFFSCTAACCCQSTLGLSWQDILSTRKKYLHAGIRQALQITI